MIRSLYLSYDVSHHKQGWHVWQKWQIHHETAFFPFSLIKSQPALRLRVSMPHKIKKWKCQDVKALVLPSISMGGDSGAGITVSKQEAI